MGSARDFLFVLIRIWTGDISYAILHSTTVPWWLLVFTSTFTGIKLWCREMGGSLIMMGPLRDCHFGHTWTWTGMHWISSPPLYHCAKVTSGFHLQPFEAFNSGIERLVAVLFWLDLWEIFFLLALGFQLWTSSAALCYCAMVTSGFHLWQFQ